MRSLLIDSKIGQRMVALSLSPTYAEPAARFGLEYFFADRPNRRLGPAYLVIEAKMT
jgi:hypothetical protein